VLKVGRIFPVFEADDARVQVVWATSREVGCGYHFCPTLNSTDPPLNNAYYVVCNYGPASVLLSLVLCMVNELQ